MLYKVTIHYTVRFSKRKQRRQWTKKVEAEDIAMAGLLVGYRVRRFKGFVDIDKVRSSIYVEPAGTKIKNKEEYERKRQRFELLCNATADSPEGQEAELLAREIRKYEQKFERFVAGNKKNEKDKRIQHGNALPPATNGASVVEA